MARVPATQPPGLWEGVNPDASGQEFRCHGQDPRGVPSPRGLPVLAGPTVQRLRLERDAALARVEALEAEVAKLESAERNQPVVCQIARARAEIEGPDERVGLEAARRIQKELAAEQIGRQLENVSFLILYGRYNGRLMEVDGVMFQLEVKGLAIGPELALYGRLTPVAQKAGGEGEPG